MQYAFTTFSCPRLSLDAVLALAAQLGYDGVELRVRKQHAHGVEVDAGATARADIRRASEQSGIALCCLGTSCSYAQPGTAPAQVAETRRYIDLAADIGAPLVRIFGGIIPAEVGRAAATESVVRSLNAVADYAAQRGVTIVQEAHDDWSAPAVLADLMQQVDHPAVGLLWDYLHTTRHGEASIDAAFDVLQPWIRHVHFHDSTLRLDRLEFRPLGTGALDTRRVLELLLHAGYDGFLSGEWINWEPYDMHLPRELAALRQIERAMPAS